MAIERDTSSFGQERRAQIDGLRALAMTGVLYVHYWDSHPLAANLRVSLFFVVSGFLITHVLHDAKVRHGQVNVLNFYIRRSLRLFPALLILIIVATLFNVDGMRESFLWHAFHLSNIYFALNQKFSPWVTAHLWSLNVLEQFYLLAPLIVLLLPARTMIVSLCLFWCLALVLRAWATTDPQLASWSSLVFSFDPVVAGSIAYLASHRKWAQSVMRSWQAVLTSVCVVGSAMVLPPGFGSSELYRVLIQPALCVLVVGAFAGYRGPIGALLESRVARFVSKISYGVFIYHLLVWWLLAERLPSLYVPGARTFLVMSAASIVAATLSWYLLERPIADLKGKFPIAAGKLRPATVPV